jgi:hypothetical protein
MLHATPIHTGMRSAHTMQYILCIPKNTLKIQHDAYTQSIALAVHTAPCTQFTRTERSLLIQNSLYENVLREERT